GKPAGAKKRQPGRTQPGSRRNQLRKLVVTPKPQMKNTKSRSRGSNRQPEILAAIGGCSPRWIPVKRLGLVGGPHLPAPLIMVVAAATSIPGSTTVVGVAFQLRQLVQVRSLTPIALFRPRATVWLLTTER